MVAVAVYVEGGGGTRNASARCRRAFSDFFGKIAPAGRRPRVVACGPRTAAFDRFCQAHASGAGVALLLVDSEGPVGDGQSSWAHLHQRDRFSTPAGAGIDQAHLMVQCMESWLLADRPTLSAYYGQGFLPGALPRNPNVEKIPNEDVFDALARATKGTKTKGRYQKVRHGFDLLARIDPAEVRRASPFAEQLCATVSAKLSSS